MDVQLDAGEQVITIAHDYGSTRQGSVLLGVACNTDLERALAAIERTAGR